MARRNPSKDDGSFNPFDSDDEADRRPTSRRAATEKQYKNPFEDAGASKPVSRHPQIESRRGSAAHRNPFSDDEEEKPKKGNLAGKLENGTLFDNYNNNNHRASKDTQSRGFKELDDNRSSNEGSRPKRGERFMSQVKERAASVGESAVRTAEKLKETSVNSAHKIRIKKPSRSLSPEVSDSIPSKGFSVPNSDLQQRDLLFADEESEKEKQRVSVDYATRRRYKNDFIESGGFENQSVQELEGYAVYKAEETTFTVNNCLKVAEDIKEDASKTLVALHQQGEQITRTHNITLNIDHDLSAGEKLLGSLGGIFSRKWKPDKTRTITGPLLTRDGSFKRRAKHMEQRTALGISKSPKGKSSTRTYPLAADTIQARVEVEKSKQDDALSDLSNVLGQLKEMAIDMGSEIGRQNESVDHLGDDVTELSYRVKGANARGRRLLGKY